MEYQVFAKWALRFLAVYFGAVTGEVWTGNISDHTGLFCLALGMVLLNAVVAGMNDVA